MPENTFDIKGGSNQILPYAQEANQYFIGDSAIRLVQYARNEAFETQHVDMTYFSGTFPEKVEHEIWRDYYLSLCEEKLKNNTVVCMTGEEGVGMTTFLSQFARRHGNNCVSYFYNGFDRIQLDPEVMEGDITEQLYWFANRCDCPYQVKHVNDVYTKVLRQLRQSKEGIMYFVFDGFGDIPSEYMENICKLIEKLQWEKARFLFSGDIGQIEGLFKHPRFRLTSLSLHSRSSLALPILREYA